MQIKDENGKVIASIDLQEGCSISDLLKSISSGKKEKNSLNTLKEIKESEDKKQIVFNFNDGFICYDLPTKTFVRKNGLKIGEGSFKSIKLNLKNKIVTLNHRERDTFWLELKEKTDVVWIKTFFSLIDIWANNKHKQGHWQSVRDRNAKNKIQVLTKDKKFFDSLEAFSKLTKIQSLNEDDLKSLYDNLLEISNKENKEDKSALGYSVRISPKSTIDKWFIERCDKAVSENYSNGESLINHMGDYIKCSTHKVKDLFQYVFEEYNGVIAFKQIEKIKKLIGFGYEPKRLMDYLYRDIYNQGLELDLETRWHNSDCALSMLCDYASMNQDMNLVYEKYPRYLSTYHDVTQKNYKIEEDKIIKEKFHKRVLGLKEQGLEYSDKEYSIVLPKNGEELVIEGQDLSHCVASYYKRMACGETAVVFLRKNSSINQSLVTIEIKDNDIVQAKGKNNSNPQEKEIEFINKYKNYLLKK